MQPADQFHLGIIVDDMEATMDSLSDALGYEWGPVVKQQGARPAAIGGAHD